MTQHQDWETVNCLTLCSGKEMAQSPCGSTTGGCLKKTQAFSPKTPRGDAHVSPSIQCSVNGEFILVSSGACGTSSLSAEYSNPSPVPKNTPTPSIRTASRPGVTSGCLVKDGLPGVFTGTPKAVNKELKLNCTARMGRLASQRQTCTKGLLAYVQVVPSTALPKSMKTLHFHN